MWLRRLAFLFMFFLTACQSVLLTAPSSTEASPSSVGPSPLLPITGSTLAPTETPLPTEKPELSSAALPPTPTALPATFDLDPADWENWPVMPIVPERAREIYELGQSLGNDPHAFSVFGDCQSEPDVFMGVYETDPEQIASLPPELQETVAWFSGSFNRTSPTVRGGTTTAALLWALWHQNKFTCTASESPLQCELRIHKPSFVIIHVGTHYEDRNQEQMRTILDQLIEAGVVPILATKADNRELDQHVNAEYAQLAVEYDIPFWNFWAAVDDLPNRGLYTRPNAPLQGDVYLTESAAAVHRMSALLVLDVLRRAVGADD